MSPRSSARPNVLVFIMDDQRLAGTMDVLPRTEAWFQADGTFFPNGVTTTPLCAPSRASLLTGRYAHNHGVQQNQVVKGPTSRGPAQFFEQIQSSLPAYLQRAGYRTGVFGRYFALLDRFDPDLVPHPLPGWNEYALISDLPYAGFDVNENGSRRWVARYSTDYLADQAERFIERTGGDDRPWFLYLAPATPHAPYVPAPRHADAPVPPLDTTDPAWFERDRRDKPPWVQTARADADSTELGWSAYLRTLKSADDLVDRVMRKLEQLDQTNTIAFYTSDHGIHWGEHGLRRKEKPYLESVRIPFFMRWPGRVASNEIDERLVANIDIAPTIIDAVDAGEPTVEMDGASLLDRSAPPRDHSVTEHFGMGPPRSTARNFYPGQFPTWKSITTSSLQYTEYYRTCLREPGKSGATPYVTDYSEVIAREYYDLISDPAQLTNQLGDVNLETRQPAESVRTKILPSPTYSPHRTAATFFIGCEPADGVDPRDLLFECRLSVAGEPAPAFRPCGTPDARAPRNFVVKTYDRLEPGAYTLEARALDATGDHGPTAGHSWTVGPLQTFSSIPDPSAPDITGEAVTAIVPDGAGGWYIAGDFSGVGGVPRSNLAHVVTDPATGARVVDEQWPAGTDGPVEALALHNSTLYVGGSFGLVSGRSGSAKRGGLAAFSLAGEVTDWDPQPEVGSTIRAIAITSGPGFVAIFAAGDFARIGGASIARLAKLDPRTGAAGAAWDAPIGTGTIHALAATEGFLYAGGEDVLAEIDVASGTVTDWSPAPGSRGGTPAVYVLTLRRGLGGLDTIIVGGRFDSIGHEPEARTNVAEVNLADAGSVTSWAPRLRLAGSTGGVQAALPFFCAHPGERVSFDPTCTTIVGGDFEGGAVETARSAGDPSDARNGAANDWSPSLDAPPLAIACWAPHNRCDIDPARTLAVGGRFATAGGIARARLAFFGQEPPDDG